VKSHTAGWAFHPALHAPSRPHDPPAVPSQQAELTLFPLAPLRLVGIGLTFKRGRDGGYVINRVVEGGPAYCKQPSLLNLQTNLPLKRNNSQCPADGGVQPGDAFLEVDGVSVHKKSPEDLTKLVLGPVGSTVELLVYREGTPRRCSLRRAELAIGNDIRNNGKIQVRSGSVLVVVMVALGGG